MTMQTTLRNVLVGLAFCANSVAYAGALGLQTSAGLHQERAYFYSQTDEQGLDNQMRPNFGVGIETLVGDKDEKVQGILKLSWVQDSAPNKPDTGDVSNAVDPPTHEEGTSHVGVLGLGIQWGLLGDPTGTQLTLSSIIGSGFLTTDNTEYVMIETGVGGTHNLNETLQLMGTIAATMRYRKHMSFGPNAYVGIRYIFD
jgi:hypothetical protein